MPKVRQIDVEAADRFLNERDEAFNEGGTGAEADAEDQRDGMDDDELSSIIAGELQDAVRFIDLEIGNERAKATKEYRGDPYGDEEEGRSSIVSRDVHDTVQGQLPDLMRIFFGSEEICEFLPEKPGDEALAEQATQYVRYVVERDNDGFSVLYSAIKDALVRKTGFVKYWWDESEEVKTEHYTGIDELGLFLLEQDASVESIEIEAEAPDASLPPDPQTRQPPKLYDVTVTRRIKHGRIRIEALPTEEFIIDRRARSLSDFTLVGHRSMKTVSELVAMGYEEDAVRPFVTSPELDTNVEYIVRQPYARVVGSFDALNPATQRVLYVEAYAFVDFDGDGIAELRKVCTMGPSYKVVFHEPVDHIPFADFHCDPEPHTFFGLSTADKTMDIQRIKTNIQRNMLDSLAQSIHPRTAVVEGQVNIDDVLNNEVGGLIRQRAPGMVQDLSTPFVGQAALGVLDYVDTIREMRTGVSRQSLGLDADALQSTNKLAIQQSITGSQGKVELIARIMAEGMRKLFRGILYLSCQNQDRPRVVQLRGGWTPVDPRTWNANMSVRINVALGSGSKEERLAALAQIAMKQEQILQTLGPMNPICTVAQYANTLRKMVELAGWRNADQFFNAVPPDWQPPQPEPPPPPPEFIIEMRKLDQQREEALWKEERERDKNVSDALLKAKELELKYHADISTTEMGIEAQDRREGQRIEAQDRREERRIAADTDRAFMGHIASMTQAAARLGRPAQPEGQPTQ